MSEKNRFLEFLRTVPGILTGITGLVVAVVGAYNIWINFNPPPTPPPEDCETKSGKENKKIVVWGELTVDLGEVESDTLLEDISLKLNDGPWYGGLTDLADKSVYTVDAEKLGGTTGIYTVEVIDLTYYRLSTKDDIVKFKVCRP